MYDINFEDSEMKAGGMIAHLVSILLTDMLVRLRDLTFRQHHPWPTMV